MRRIPQALTSLDNAAKKQCVKDSDKKAFCDHVNGFEIHYAKDAQIETKGKIVSVGSNDFSYPGESNLGKLLATF